MSSYINDLADRCHKTAVEHGFYETFDVPVKLALIHSEVSEALEDYRTGHMERLTVDGRPVGFPSELADIVIRVFDLAAHLKINIEQEILDKMDYNETRSYRHGGKLV